jgi:hypothetical protein
MNWLHYLLEANLYLAVFYAGYYLFLSKETYYTLNRVYLLFSCAVSFALPLMQLGILKPVEQPLAAVNFSFPVQTVAVDTVKYDSAAPPAIHVGKWFGVRLLFRRGCIIHPAFGQTLSIIQADEGGKFRIKRPL